MSYMKIISIIFIEIVQSRSIAFDLDFQVQLNDDFREHIFDTLNLIIELNHSI